MPSKVMREEMLKSIALYYREYLNSLDDLSAGKATARLVESTGIYEAIRSLISHADDYARLVEAAKGEINMSDKLRAALLPFEKE